MSREFEIMTDREIRRLRKRIRKLEEGLRPFSDPEFGRPHPGCQYKNSIVYEKNRAPLLLGDFQRAQSLMKGAKK